MPILQATADGVLIGGVYALLSVGLSLVFGTMRILNFAQGAFIMVGMYLAYFLWKVTGIDPIIGSIPTFVATFFIGGALYYLLLKPILKGAELSQIFLTVALMMVMESGALMLLGGSSRAVSTPYGLSSFGIVGLRFNLAPALAFLVALVMTVGLHLLLRKTWLGRSIRAVAQNSAAASMVGVNVNRTYAIAFGIGVALTAMGGAIILPFATLTPTTGHQYIVIIFTVVVLGGLGNTTGALVGGLLVGLVQQLSTLILNVSAQNLTVFVLFLLVLTFRPEGILKK